MNVIYKVVQKGLCVGCGICAAVCPKSRLEIRWNERGEYNPVEVEGCAECNDNCSICYQVCPVHGNTMDETEIGEKWYGDTKGIRYRKETGYHLSSYVGYSKDHRANSASGGLASWMLETLLTSGEVDAVVAVCRTTNPNKLFQFTVCQGIEDIRSCGRSAYYPVEVSQIIHYILHNEGRYAIIGLPCVCKAVRLAQEKYSKLNKRIVHLLGLTCGHQCSKFFAEYICALAGGNPHQLSGVIFRTKDLSQPASNPGITFWTGQGENEVHKQVLWKTGVGAAYSNGYFQIPGCFYCDDVFAECADACFMDAWLPEYIKDPKGTSLLLVRSERIDKIVRKGRKKTELAIDSIAVRKIIRSQESVIERKRNRKTLKGLTPMMRKAVLNRTPLSLITDTTELYKLIAISSTEYWVNNKDYEFFTEAMKPYKKKVLGHLKKKRIVLLPYVVIQRLLYRLDFGHY